MNFPESVLPALPYIILFAVPLILLPFVMRFLIARIILYRVKRIYLPRYLRSVHTGWESEQDIAAIDAVCDYVLNRLRYHFVFRENFIADAEQVLLIIQNAFSRKGPSEKLSYSFSIRKLLECSLLAFSDLYSEYLRKGWFRFIRNTRLLWFRRVNFMAFFYNSIFNLPLLSRLRTMRVIGPLFRLLFIPLVGLPSFLWYVIRALSVTVLFEGFFRFFYALVLLKIGYYGLYLYGRGNTDISRRIRDIPKSRIGDINRRIEELLHPQKWPERSVLYQSAIEIYRETLAGYGISADARFSAERPGPARAVFDSIRKLLDLSIRAHLKGNGHPEHPASDRDRLLLLYRRIGTAYYPRSAEPILTFRIREILEMGYMGSILLLDKVLSTPGVRFLLDRVSIDFMLKMKSFAEHDAVRLTAGQVRNSLKLYRNYRQASDIFRIVRGIATPYTVIWHLGSPVLYEQLSDMLRQFVYHRAGRLLIYGWESNILKTKRDISPILW